jgi:coenzyme F420-0:L-glutamate ligase/coenzyme F420-1:gamma-L-glutamate ligase
MGAAQLIFTAVSDLPHFQPGDDLARLILEALPHAKIELVGGDVLIIAQKIVSKVEGRLVDLRTINPGPEAIDLATKTGKDPRLVELILAESQEVLRTRRDLIIVEHRLGFVCANAGIDHSNVGDQDDNWALLLPKDPDSSAAAMAEEIENISGVSVGVLIIDSHGRAWRMGTVGTCIGAAGVPTLVDLRGKPDLFGRILRTTQIGLADEIAAGASALMGQANEGRPVVHLRGLPYPQRAGSAKELLRPKVEDLFR